MVVTLLILILATLLLGAAAVRGAIGKLLLFAASTIGLTALVVWLGKDNLTALLWILFILTLGGWIVGKAIEDRNKRKFWSSKRSSSRKDGPLQ